MPSISRPRHWPLRGAALALLALLGACTDHPTEGPGTEKPQAAPLGVVEVTLTGIGSEGMRASASTASALDGARFSLSGPANSGGTGSNGIQLQQIATGSFTQGARAAGGYRYVWATFRVRNADKNGTAYDTPRQNLTFLGVSTTGTLGGTAISQLNRFDGSAADPAIASAILPTGQVGMLNGALVSSQPDVLQLFADGDVSSVPVTAGSVALPYGFVARRVSDNSRTLPASPAVGQFDGVVTFAFKIPLQASSAADPFTVSAMFVATDDAQTRITQSLEEQGAAAQAAFQARATAIGATAVTLVPRGTYTGPASTRMLCNVRTAGTSGSPTAVAVPCPAIGTVVVSPASTRYAVGGTQSVTATVTDADGYAADWATLSWASGNTGVATVGATGARTATITAGGLGTATVTASTGGRSGAAAVSVQAVSTVDVSPVISTQLVGRTVPFSAMLKDASGNVLNPGGVSWTSSNAAVATVNAAGLVTLVAEGTATITATVNGASDTGMIEGINLLPETITAGRSHTCGITTSGAAYCWGNGGTTGDGGQFDRYTPVAVQMPAGVTFKQISAGNGYTVALSTTGVAYAWGRNDSNQIGDGTTTPRPMLVAVQMPAGVTFKQISAGYEHIVALSTTGVAYAWGGNSEGQLDGTATPRSVPVAVQMPAGVTFKQISAGFSHTMALSTTGVAYGWGRNNYGQLGDGTTTPRYTPVAVQVPSGVTFKQISGGALHTVALSTTGAAYTWGWNVHGQLGNGTVTDSRTPVAVQMPGGVTFKEIGTGYHHTVALSPTGVAYSWGWNADGQLGIGTITNSRTPAAVQVPSGVTFGRMRGGYNHTVAVSTTGAAYAWGNRADGRLGIGQSNDEFQPSPRTPVEVLGGLTFQLP